MFKGGFHSRNLRTFNQKIQWIKLYGITDFMRACTDKVKVRDYVKEKIGEEYLKPVLQIIGACHSENLENQNNNLVDFQVVQNLTTTKKKEEKMLKQVQHDDPTIDFTPKLTDVSTYFDKINFDKLPNAFVIKTNHGCKWQYIIKDKEQFLQNKQLFETVKQNITGWLGQEYWCWGGFEMQYKGIEPKILIEPLMCVDENKEPVKINVWCFSGEPKIYVKFFDENKMSVWNENFEPIKDFFISNDYVLLNADEILKQSYVLSKSLSEAFNFVRIDWMIYKNKLYFEEMTFTPYSGFGKFKNKGDELKLGSWITEI